MIENLLTMEFNILGSRKQENHGQALAETNDL